MGSEPNAFPFVNTPWIYDHGSLLAEYYPQQASFLCQLVNDI